MSETTEAANSVGKKKTETVYTKVTMTDGREVQFPGKRRLMKEVLVDEANGEVTARFDFLNGQTRSISSKQLSGHNALYALGHGLGQKCGDTIASMGESPTEDLVLEIEAVIEQLVGGDWNTKREAGDSMAGSGIVVRAVAEHLGKPVEFVKAFIDRKLEVAKAAGQKLSRQDLYAAFRKPGSPTGIIIKRMEEEKLAKATSNVNLDELLSEAASA